MALNERISASYTLLSSSNTGEHGLFGIDVQGSAGIPDRHDE